MYLVFARTPGDNYRRRLRSLLLCLCDSFLAYQLPCVLIMLGCRKLAGKCVSCFLAEADMRSRLRVESFMSEKKVRSGLRDFCLRR